MSTGLTTIQTNLEDNIATLTAIMGVNMNGLTETQLVTMVKQEIQYVVEHAMNTPSIAECSPESILICVRKAIKNNLTLEPDAKLMYLIPGSVKMANGSYAKVLTSPFTVNGALSVAYQCGTILDHERPIAEYDAAGKCIKVTVRLLRPSQPAPRWETITYEENYFKKWRAASHKKNARGKGDASTVDYSNALYKSFNGGIDPEFAIAKSLRHALEKLGTNGNAKLAAKITINKEKQVNVDVEAQEFAEVEVLTDEPPVTSKDL